MPLDRLILLLVVVIAAAGITVWLLTGFAAPELTQDQWYLAIPIVLVIYVVLRVRGMRRND